MVRLTRAANLLAALTFFTVFIVPAASARLFKGALIESKDGTIRIEKSRLDLRTNSPVLVEETRDKTGTSISIRPEGGFGYRIRVDRLTIGKHAFAPAERPVDAEYLSDVLTKLRVVTYRQRGVKLLSTIKEEAVIIEQTSTLLAVDKMSVDAHGNYIPELYRGFLLFERGGSLIIAHFDSPTARRGDPVESYTAQLTAILRALTIQPGH